MKDDMISRQAALDALGERPTVWTDDDDYALGERNQYDMDRLAIETVPPAQPSVSKTEIVGDVISRQAAVKALEETKQSDPFNRYEYQNIGIDWSIDAIKALPPASFENHDEIKSYSKDTISRSAAIEVMRKAKDKSELHRMLIQLPSAQPKCEDTVCPYCHEDSDGYVQPLEKNGHAFIRFGMNGWEIDISTKGWHGSAKIRYCPMCGRDLLVK